MPPPFPNPLVGFILDNKKHRLCHVYNNTYKIPNKIILFLFRTSGVFAVVKITFSKNFLFYCVPQKKLSSIFWGNCNCASTANQHMVCVLL